MLDSCSFVCIFPFKIVNSIKASVNLIFLFCRQKIKSEGSGGGGGGGSYMRRELLPQQQCTKLKSMQLW